jgi:hypothetical protein
VRRKRSLGFTTCMLISGLCRSDAKCFFFSRFWTVWETKVLFYSFKRRQISVARCYIFKPKISIRLNFVRSCNGGCWYVFVAIVSTYFTAKWYILNGHLVYLMPIWYIQWLSGTFLGNFVYIYSHFVYFFPVLVCCAKKNLADPRQIVVCCVAAAN